MRKFEIGSKVYHSESNITGVILRFYTPTSCEEQIVIRTSDGRMFHAPTNEFKSYISGNKPSMTIIDEYVGVDLASSEDFLVRMMYDQNKKSYTSME